MVKDIASKSKKLYKYSMNKRLKALILFVIFTLVSVGFVSAYQSNLWKLNELGKSGVVSLSKAGTQFTKSSLKMGRDIHKLYKADLHDPTKGLFKEFRDIKGIRPDFVDFNTKTIYELKPYNPANIKLGTQQLNNYKSIFEQKYGGTWNTVLDFY